MKHRVPSEKETLYREPLETEIVFQDPSKITQQQATGGWVVKVNVDS